MDKPSDAGSWEKGSKEICMGSSIQQIPISLASHRRWIPSVIHIATVAVTVELPDGPIVYPAPVPCANSKGRIEGHRERRQLAIAVERGLMC